MSMWNETRSRPITTRLQEAVGDATAGSAAARAEGKEHVAAELEKLADMFRAEIAKREADSRYHVTVRHVGAPDKHGDPPDLFRYQEILANEQTAIHEARVRARKFLLAQGENADDEAITKRTLEDPAWKRANARILEEWVVAGLVGGRKEFERLYELGCEDGGHPGGSSLLIHAVDEVKAFNQAPAEKKSG